MPLNRLAGVPRPLSLAETVEVVLRHRPLYELAALLPERQPIGRKPGHPAALLLLYGVLVRVFRSGQRVQIELSRPEMWNRVLQVVREMAQDPSLPVPRHADGQPMLPPRAPTWETWRYLRDAYLVHEDVQTAIRGRFTELAVAQARLMGLLSPTGPGSLCHPDPTRVIYGDGTVIRPMYRPPKAIRVPAADGSKTRAAYPDPSTGELRDRPGRRFDPDAAAFHGHSGPVHGNNFVLMYSRTGAFHGRVVLSVDRVDAPGREAESAVRSIEAIHAVAGSGIQAVVYDGALRGRHIEHLMTNLGLVVVNKVAAAPTPGGRDRNAARGMGRKSRWLQLGVWEHQTSEETACMHALAAVDGAVCEVAISDSGEALVRHRLQRKQVKRPRRATGKWHFSVAFAVPCQHGEFLAWVSPHVEPGDLGHRRPDATRLIAPGEPDFDRLYNVRSDAENANSELKRTLLVDRAMSLGWRRQLIDVLMWSLLNNALTEHHEQQRRTAGGHRPERVVRRAA